MNYRPDIDGLRAIAVMGVIAFHTGLGFLPGGYVGVDVFFVISGYLITRIVARETDAGTFTFAGFYARRMRRILPALLAVIVAVIPFAWFWLLPEDLERVGESVWTALLFVSNFHFYGSVDYFDVSAELRPLIHTWSLAVEEQFYIFFPIIFVLAYRFGRRMVIGLPLVLGVASLLAAEIAYSFDAAAAFYWTPFRIWEFCAGIVLAVSGWRAPDRLARWLGALGLVMIVGAMVGFEPTSRVPGLMGLIPVLGAVLVLSYGDRGPVNRILSLAPLVGIGLISYSAYLWHQPVFAFARLRLGEEPGPLLYLTLTVLTLGLATLTWRFVEQPFRHPARMPTRPFVVTAFATTLALLATAFVFDVGKGVANRLSPAVRAVLADDNKNIPAGVKACMAANEDWRPGEPVKGCLLHEAANEPIIYLIGDSHARMLAGELAKAAAASGQQVMLTAASGCTPFDIAVDTTKEERCTPFRKRFEAISRNDNPLVNTVVLSARWAVRLSESRFDNGEGGKEHGPPIPTKRSLEERVARGTSILSDYVAGETAKGRRVFLVYPLPEQGWNIRRRMASSMIRGDAGPRPISVARDRVDAYLAPARRMLDAIPDQPDLIRLDPRTLFCDASRCFGERDGVPLYADDDHVNAVGARLIVDSLMARLSEL